MMAGPWRRVCVRADLAVYVLCGKEIIPNMLSGL